MSLSPMGATLNNMENLRSANKPKVSDQLLEMARKEPDAVLKELESQSNGLSLAEAEARVKREGLNEIAREKRQSPLMRLWDNVRNPLVILLIGLGILSYLTGDLRAMIVIFVMAGCIVSIEEEGKLTDFQIATKVKKHFPTCSHFDLSRMNASPPRGGEFSLPLLIHLGRCIFLF